MKTKKQQFPWNKGTKGLVKSNKGSFKKGDTIIPHKLGCNCCRCLRISPMKGKTRKQSKEEREKRSKIAKEKNYGVWSKGRKLSEEHKRKISESEKGKKAWNKGIKHTSEHKEKLRLSRIKQIEESGISTGMSIGKYETHILDNLEKYLNYTILRQHRVAGYFLDGYCPVLNLAIEIDEKYHNKQKEKDAYRQKIIENKLNCKFLRIDIK